MVATTKTVYQQDTGMSRESNSPLEFKEILVETVDTADATNTYTVTLADYGITSFISFKCWAHTTNHQVIKSGTAATTSVTAGVLTVTLATDTANQKYVHLIGGY